jgi:murein L,D-transpeptidase YafK
MRIIIWLTLMSFNFSNATSQSFLSTQLKNSRVKKVWSNKSTSIKKLLTDKKISIDKLEIFIRAFKTEDKLEVWTKNKSDEKFILFKTYDVCAKSGVLGPKMKQGDGQVPEGIYSINRFNPTSTYYLSLGLNYPNAADKKRSKAKDLGGDIFIHGKCVTIGCLPLTDEWIEEVYMLAVLAKSAGQKDIIVHIFPFQMNERNWRIAIHTEIGKTQQLFWENLKSVYSYFEENQKVGVWKTDVLGKYMR